MINLCFRKQLYHLYRCLLTIFNRLFLPTPLIERIKRALPKQELELISWASEVWAFITKFFLDDCSSSQKEFDDCINIPRNAKNSQWHTFSKAFEISMTLLLVTKLPILASLISWDMVIKKPTLDRQERYPLCLSFRMLI